MTECKILTLTLVQPEAAAAVIKRQIAGSTRALDSIARKEIEILVHDLKGWRWWQRSRWRNWDRCEMKWGCDTGHTSNLINLRRPKRPSFCFILAIFCALEQHPYRSSLTVVATSVDEYGIHY